MWDPEFKARMERGKAGLAGGHSGPVLLRQVPGLADHLCPCSGQVKRSHGVDLWHSLESCIQDAGVWSLRQPGLH